jgi:hypothetical protein
MFSDKDIPWTNDLSKMYFCITAPKNKKFFRNILDKVLNIFGHETEDYEVVFSGEINSNNVGTWDSNSNFVIKQNDLFKDEE